ncbi:sulfotransferase [Sulfurimonas sp. HSL-1716]|uniref:sulfotransferase family protein n=1 Tax=Hydrocurvibacter sulfurireducens TaxID=3131937 RepID=UPI0031F7D412
MKKNILFIVGSPRSGTTWIQKVMATHSLFETGQESDFFTTIGAHNLKVFKNMLEYKDVRCGLSLPAYFTYEQFLSSQRELFYKMISYTADLSGEKYFIEKTPSHALVIDTINEILPESKFILMIRNPYDVVKSILNGAKTWGKGHFPATVESAADMWYAHNKLALDSLKNISKERYKIIRYEDLEKNNTLISDMFSLCNVELSAEEIAELFAIANEYRIKIYGEFGTQEGKECEEDEMFNKHTRKEKLIELSDEEKSFIDDFLHTKEIYDEFRY